MAASKDAVLGVGGPLEARPADVLVGEAFAAELEQQRGLLTDVGFADIAYTVMLIETGTVPLAAGAELLAGLLVLQTESDTFSLDPALGDVYTNREAWLDLHAGGVGYLGVGRARREAITTGYTLAVRRHALAFVRALLDVGEALVDVAERHRTSLMPDYTYLQASQPTSFGHYLLGFVFALSRDLERARSLFERLDRCPAGCGSTNGSALPLDRERVAALLGFADIVEHARDAMWQSDGPIEALATACAAIVNLDRLAEDLTIFSTAEFGFITLADAHSRASKVMPQKKNPFALSYVRAVANRTIGVQAGVAAAGRTPSGQMDNRLYAYGDVPKAFAEVAGAAELMAGVVRELDFDASIAQATLERSFAFGSDLAELLMRVGDLDYRTAHALVAKVLRCLQHGDGAREPAIRDAIDNAAQSMLGRALLLSPRDVAAALDPMLALQRRDGAGGAAPDQVTAMVLAARRELGDTAAWHTRTARHCADSERRLVDVARRMTAQHHASIAATVMRADDSFGSA